MRNLALFLMAGALLAQACSAFKSTSSKGADLKPAEYKSTGNVQLDYIQLYRQAAVTEMERGGVPASIILAQGILESASGQSDLAKEANNHFGIKCGNSWNGKTYYKKDDERDENGNLKESCFRRYGSVSESFYDHGEFLRDPRKYNRYGPLFNLERTDYKSWAKGLQGAGYATDPKYADRLIELIERYRLYDYDRPGGPAIPQPGVSGATTEVETDPSGKQRPVSLTSRVRRVNDVKVVLSKEGETLEDIARLYRINPDKVVNYNDRGYAPGVRLRPGTMVYIQPKKDKWHGRASEHFVREGQNMFDISQQYGISLAKLRQRNNLTASQEPMIGEKIKLKGSLKKGEVIRLRDPNTDPIKPGMPGNPPVQPDAPDPGTMTPSEELPFVIGDDKPTNSDNKPPATPGTPPGKPALSNEPYPGADPTPARPDNTTNNPQTNTPEAPAPDGYHRVVKGDTLFSLARKYNTTVAKIKQLNKMTDDNIKIGQNLRIR